ncbi:MAG: 3-dehydroquinate synthase, partial [Planctomycetes bacterium]|nr:3-dehydroquinate synthase [Planctomycetota bacterium]
VTVGGGVVGDLGGFVASTYMRGLALFHVPTTLLAQVDASIGGKTAVNLRRGKNLVGTFHRPRGVFIDPMTLASLPQREFVGGLAEVAKAAMIRDAELFAYLEANAAAILAREPGPLEEIVFRAASVKAAVVEEDEREAGLREILNYGHTVGHAIEAAAGFKGHHGEAVSAGMEAEAKIATDLGILAPDATAAQGRLIESLGLPRRVSGVSRTKVRDAMSADKKSRDGRLRFALPEAVGRARFGVEVPDETVDAALAMVLS